MPRGIVKFWRNGFNQKVIWCQKGVCLVSHSFKWIRRGRRCEFYAKVNLCVNSSSADKRTSLLCSHLSASSLNCGTQCWIVVLCLMWAAKPHGTPSEFMNPGSVSSAPLAFSLSTLNIANVSRHMIPQHAEPIHKYIPALGHKPVFF